MPHLAQFGHNMSFPKKYKTFTCNYFLIMSSAAILEKSKEQILGNYQKC